MATTTTHNSKTTNTVGFQPGKALQETVFKGKIKYVVLNGSKIKMVHDGRQWWNVEVTAA